MHPLMIFLCILLVGLAGVAIVLAQPQETTVDETGSDAYAGYEYGYYVRQHEVVTDELILDVDEQEAFRELFGLPERPGASGDEPPSKH
jgi:hypothetical protein